MKLIAIIAAVVALSSCTLTIAPDGTRTYSLNGTEAVHAIQVIADK